MVARCGGRKYGKMEDWKYESFHGKNGKCGKWKIGSMEVWKYGSTEVENYLIINIEHRRCRRGMEVGIMESPRGSDTFLSA